MLLDRDVVGDDRWGELESGHGWRGSMREDDLWLRRNL
jgi:hypothetical protein